MATSRHNARETKLAKVGCSNVNVWSVMNHTGIKLCYVQYIGYERVTVIMIMDLISSFLFPDNHQKEQDLMYHTTLLLTMAEQPE